MPVPDSVAVWRSSYVNIDLQTIPQIDKKMLITKNVSDLFSQPQSDEIMVMFKMKA